MTDRFGDSGNNVLNGTETNDSLFGLDGEDTLNASIGNDLLDGGDGIDTADYTSLDSPITLERAGAVNKGLLGNDQILDIERIIGAEGQANAIDGSTGLSDETSFTINLQLKSNQLTVNDVPGLGDLVFTVENFTDVTGTSQGDSIVGGNPNNLFRGGSGNDGVSGVGGNDTLFGEAGNDVLIGGRDADVLVGGEDNDTYKYNSIFDSTPTSKDTIEFQQGSDKIDLRAIDADTSVFGKQAFTFIGTASFTAAPFNTTNGQVRYDAANNLIQAEIQGDNDLIADLEIRSSVDFASLSASDFIL